MRKSKNHVNARPTPMHTMPARCVSGPGPGSSSSSSPGAGAHTRQRPRRASAVLFECGAEHAGTCTVRQKYGSILEAEADLVGIAADVASQLGGAASTATRKPARILVSGTHFVVEYPSKAQARHPLSGVLAADVLQRDVITTPPSSILQLVYRADAGEGVVCCERFNVFTKDLPHICRLVQPDTCAVNDRVFARRSTRKTSSAGHDERTAC